MLASATLLFIVVIKTLTEETLTEARDGNSSSILRLVALGHQNCTIVPIPVYG
jgi:hypothetical protein